VKEEDGKVGEVGDMPAEPALLPESPGLGFKSGPISRSTINALLLRIELWNTNDFACTTLNFLEMNVTFPKGDEEGQRPSNEDAVSELLREDVEDAAGDLDPFDEVEGPAAPPGMTRKFSLSQSTRRRDAKRV